VHEVLQNDDGTLSVRMPTEAQRAFGDPAPVRLEVSDTGWTREAGSYRVESTYAYSAVLSEKMPDTYLLEGELMFERDAGEAGVLLGVHGRGDAGYFLRFNLDGQALQFGKIGGYRSVLSLPFPNCYLDHMPELDRPLDIRCGIPLRYRVIVDKSAIVAYVDDRVALSGRMYATPFGGCGLFADGTTVLVTDLTSRSIRKIQSA
jgi:beta-fructofuranosidase